MEFPIIFNKCPLCGCPDTVTRLACEEEMEKGIIPKDAPVALERTQIPLMGKVPPKLTVRMLIASWDVCAGDPPGSCGHRYCTRVDIVTTPVQVQAPKMPGPGGQFPGFPQGLKPQGFG